MLAETIEILKHLPERYVEKALEALRDLKSEHEKEEKVTIPSCPKCQGETIVRNGHKHGKQDFLCRSCGTRFVETSQTALFNSHSGESVWKQVIRDTVHGVPLDKTGLGPAVAPRDGF